MKNKNKLLTILLIITFSFAGTGKSVGTAGGTELLIPTGAKGIALNGANNATVSGFDALFFNPAGISNLGSGVETQFSNTNYIADIGMSYLALAGNMGKNTIALSVKSFDFGDIAHTTAGDPTGASGRTFSPQFLTITAGYSKAYTDRIRFGASIKLVNETILLMFLIFDTETTGLPKKWNSPLTDFDNWPRAVQIAWQINSEEGQCISNESYVIYPEGYTIPYDSQNIHGISTQLAKKIGKNINEVLQKFNDALNQSKYICGHNLNFDEKITRKLDGITSRTSI